MELTAMGSLDRSLLTKNQFGEINLDSSELIAMESYLKLAPAQLPWSCYMCMGTCMRWDSHKDFCLKMNFTSSLENCGNTLKNNFKKACQIKCQHFWKQEFQISQLVLHLIWTTRLPSPLQTRTTMRKCEESLMPVESHSRLWEESIWLEN